LRQAIEEASRWEAFYFVSTVAALLSTLIYHLLSIYLCAQSFLFIKSP